MVIGSAPSSAGAGRPAAASRSSSACTRSGDGGGSAPLLLVLPLFAFLTVTFVVPIGRLLLTSVYDPELSNLLPNTGIAIRDWNGEDLPDEPVFMSMENLRAYIEGRSLPY